jgi:hypothetical protein
MIHVKQFKEVYDWLRQNNPNYAGFKEFQGCPCPISLEDDNSMNEGPKNPTIEKQLEVQYWFHNNGDPIIKICVHKASHIN